VNGGRTRTLFAAAAGLAAGGVLLLLIVLAAGGDLADATDDVVPFVFAAAAGLALYGWWREKAASSRSEQESSERQSLLESRERELAKAEERRERAEKDAKRSDDALLRERALRERIDRARRAEREWAKELRGQISRMHRENGFLGRTDDVRKLVLHVARTLTEADKAMLLAREDDDGDGKLDLVAYEGFDHDPSESAVAQRFAEEVIEEDTTIRVDHPTEGARSRTDADEEIDNLVAIPIFIQDNFSGVVVCANREGGFEELDDDVLLSLGDHAGTVLENGKLRGALRGAYVATVRMLADTIEAKDPFLRIHSEHVYEYVSGVADRLGVEPRRREELLFASLLHDVGKIGISERILLKPSGLTDDEFAIIKLHSRIGARLIEQVPALESMSPAILHHHERFDGDGYPTGLKGEQIPLEARIICVADSFSAMTSERPYREPVPHEEALRELERCAGTQFDPQVVKHFVDEVRKRPPARDGGPMQIDPELQLLRSEGEPVLGYGPVGLTDNLTLLYSPRHLHEVAEAEASRAELQDRPFAVAMLALENLAELNAEEGWAAGDKALLRVARAVERAAARCDGTACRYSGRHFALLAPDTGPERADALLRELLADLDGAPSMNTGMAHWEAGASGADVLEKARLALELPERRPAAAG
jgi:diguanylate cyclase (GGDEF)-like protein